MNFQQLKHFVVTAETGNILKASEILYISQSGLSRSISALENLVGLPLFERSAKGVKLTQFGEHFYPGAKLMLNEFKRYTEDLKNFRDLKAGSITLGISHSFVYMLIPEVVSEMFRRWPSIEINIVTGGYQTLAEKLMTGDIDIAFSLYTDQSKVADLEYDHLLDVRTRIFAREGHPLHSLSNITVDELCEARWALVKSRSSQVAFDSYFENREKDPPPISLQCASVSLLSHAVANSDLLTILPEELIVGGWDSNLKLLPTDDYFGLARVGLIRRESSQITPIEERFAKLLKQEVVKLRSSHIDAQDAN
jgi:DNA-binding transcriptional LysR family regulator